LIDNSKYLKVIPMPWLLTNNNKKPYPMPWFSDKNNNKS